MTAILFLPAYVLAQDNGEDLTPMAEEAPQEVIATAKEACETWAVADGILDSELETYMRVCVDDELEYHGYRRLQTRSASD